MGFLNNNSERLEYLEEERKKLWSRITELENLTVSLQNEVETRTPDIEKEARQHSKKASEFRNKTQKRLEESMVIVSELSKELDAIREAKIEIDEKSVEVNEQKISVDGIKSRLEEDEVEYQKKLATLNSKIDVIDSILIKYPDLTSKIEEVEDFIEKIEENFEKSGVSLSSLNKRKKEVDDLYREIFGYTEKNDETHEVTKIDGLKDELESTYSKLSEQMDQAFENIEGINSNYEDQFRKFVGEYREQYDSINKEINDLLPGAMTAGLSSAFSKKKEDEEAAAEELQKRFSIGIYFMIVVSLIPVIISVVFLYQNITLQEVIERLPRLVLAIVPIYIPVLWFTYSANKKLNLSKRLIEEYTHKEVLSRTYQGLSEQISNIKNKEQSEELKTRLLASFLQVSSENPGKLISNYEASDHPVMEALEQTYKFQVAIDRLEGIPGLGKVAAIFEKNAKNKLKDKQEKIDQALEKHPEAIHNTNSENGEEK